MNEYEQILSFGKRLLKAANLMTVVEDLYPDDLYRNILGQTGINLFSSSVIPKDRQRSVWRIKNQGEDYFITSLRSSYGWDNNGFLIYTAGEEPSHLLVSEENIDRQLPANISIPCLYLRNTSTNSANRFSQLVAMGNPTILLQYLEQIRQNIANGKPLAHIYPLLQIIQQ